MLEAQRLTKQYGETLALDGLDLTVENGQITALLGPNGAGKTTTAYLFLGFVRPTSGQARIDGLDIAEHPIATKDRLAYIPERLALYESMSGLENLAYFQVLGGGRRSQSELLECLAKVGLDERAARRRVGGYSKGMRQKVGIAIALAKSARTFILDEPLSGLDPKAAGEFCAQIRALRDAGSAILMATHDLFRARDLADKIGIMRGGKLVALLDSSAISSTELEARYLEHMR